MPKGKTFIICGPSGVGKGTVVSRLLEADPTLYFSVSATTRAPRAGEADGVHYHFLTRERFQEWIDAGDFLEHAQFVGNFYGTPRRYVDEAMDQGRDVLLDIEIQGAEQVKRKRPETVRIYVAPPSWAELERRLVGRGTDAPEKIRERVEKAEYEMSFAPRFDTVIVNDDLPAALAEAERKVKAFLAS